MHYSVTSSRFQSMIRASISLRVHFAAVSTDIVDGWVTFTVTTMARDYVASSIIYGHLADRVPELSEPLRVRRRNAVIVAEL